MTYQWSERRAQSMQSMKRTVTAPKQHINSVRGMHSVTVSDIMTVCDSVTACDSVTGVHSVTVSESVCRSHVQQAIDHAQTSNSLSFCGGRGGGGRGGGGGSDGGLPCGW